MRDRCAAEPTAVATDCYLRSMGRTAAVPPDRRQSRMIRRRVDAVPEGSQDVTGSDRRT